MVTLKLSTVFTINIPINKLTDEAPCLFQDMPAISGDIKNLTTGTVNITFFSLINQTGEYGSMRTHWRNQYSSDDNVNIMLKVSSKIDSHFFLRTLTK